MKILKLVPAIIVIALFSGCARHPRPVAMNLYTPNGDTEKISGVSVVVTKDMIRAAKARMHKNRRVK